MSREIVTRRQGVLSHVEQALGITVMQLCDIAKIDIHCGTAVAGVQ